MFDEVTRGVGGKRAARRGAWVAASSTVQALLVVAIVVLSTRIAAEVAAGPLVDVTFVKPAAPPPPPPPPPRAAPRPRPKVQAEKPRTRPHPVAMVQPKEVQQELKPPDPAEPEEEDQGVEGGVVGGVVGGVTGGTGPATGAPGGIVDAPVYATAGFAKPQEAERGCVGRSVRLSDELLDSFVGSVVGGSVTVKFAIGRDGTPSQFQIVSVMRDPRVAQVIWRAVQSCRWIPGADAQGRPTPIWVILPLRFSVQ